MRSVDNECKDIASHDVASHDDNLAHAVPCVQSCH